jgi:hypothetical protein
VKGPKKTRKSENAKEKKETNVRRASETSGGAIAGVQTAGLHGYGLRPCTAQTGGLSARFAGTRGKLAITRVNSERQLSRNPVTRTWGDAR